MGTYEIELLPAQRKFIEIPENIKPGTQYYSLYQGGVGSGKTWSGSLKGLLIALKYPGSEGLVGAATYALLSQTTLPAYKMHLDNMGYRYDWNEKKQTLTLQNGSTILFKHFENPEDIKSIDKHWCEIEEMSQISEDSFLMIMSRIRKPPRPEWADKYVYQIFGHTNPQASKGWIYDKFKKNPQPNFRRIIAPTTENVHLPKDFVENLKANSSEEYFAINVLGQDDTSESLLAVKGFNHSVQVREDLTIDNKYPIHLTCDFNVDPMCWYICQDYGNMTYVLYEFVIENTTTPDCTQLVAETLGERFKSHPIIINGDATGQSKTTKGVDYNLMKTVLYREGFTNLQVQTLKKNPSIEWRMSCFNEWMQDHTGKHHILIHPQCEHFIYNLENVEIKEGTSKPKIPSTGELKRNPKAKYLIHPIDAVSYLICLYHPIRKESEWFSYNNRQFGTDVFGGKYDKRLI